MVRIPAVNDSVQVVHIRAFVIMQCSLLLSCHGKVTWGEGRAEHDGSGSVTLCGILLFPGVLQFAGKQTRRAAAAWGGDCATEA